MWRGTAVSRIGAFTKIESITRIVKGARSGIFAVCEILPSASKKRRGFEDFNGKRREEPAFATIPTVSA